MANLSRRPDGAWRARYLDAAGKQVARHFGRKVDAQHWLDEVTTSVITGNYVAARAGRETFQTYAESWLGRQVFKASTAEAVERALRVRVYPVIGDRRLDSLTTDDVQTLVKRLSMALAPATVGVTYSHVASVLKSAVAAKRIAVSPCVGVKLPEVTRTRVVPLTTDQLLALRDAVPERFRAMVTLAAGTGMRQGELLGLTLDRVDFLRRRVTIDRQMVTLANTAPDFGSTKRPASNRVVPLPQVVIETVARHVEVFRIDHHDLLFTSVAGAPMRRNAFSDMWRRASIRAGLGTVNFHDLRHYYASLLIRHGESVKTVQDRLGHKSAAETLDTYSHLWPDSEDRTREAIDAVLGNLGDFLGLGPLPRAPETA